MPGRGAAQRQQERRAPHVFRDVGGRVRPRAAFADEPEAHAAANRVFALTGRRYSTYACSYGTCGAWHIRPCALRPADLVRPA